MRKLLSSMRVRLTCLCLLVTLPVIVGLIVAIDVAVSDRLRSAAEKQLEYESNDLARLITQWDEDASATVRTLAALPSIARMNPAEQKPILAAAVKLHPHLGSLQITDTEGNATVRSDEEPLQTFRDREWLRITVRGQQDLVRQAVISRHGEPTPILIYATPIRDASGTVVGTVSGPVDLLKLSDEASTMNLGYNGYRFVTDDKGRVVAHQKSQFVRELRSLVDFPPIESLLSGQPAGLLRFSDEQGVIWLAFARTLPNGWCAVSLQQEDDVVGALSQYRVSEIFGAGGAILLLVAFTWLVSLRLTNPITQLAAVAGEVAKGRLDQRFDEHGPAEVAQLAKSFNRMVARLETDYRNIEAKVERRTQALKLRNTELQRARHAAEQETRLKDEFLANMSHEIRTPLTAILGYAELLVDLPMSEEERSKALQSIQYNSQHLLNIINDVLDVAKLEANKMEAECVEFPPVVLIHDVVSLMRSKANEKGIQLGVEFAGELPEQVKTDPTRLRQILLNLVSNAVKYTQQGSVRLMVRLLSGTDLQEAYLQFDVIDTGIGLTPEQLGRLFKPFSQAAASTSRQYGGSGLGLVISQKLARLLGGDIAVKSTFGEGSTFTCTVKIGPVVGQRMVNPRAQLHDTVAALPFADDEQSKALTGVRVLVADDTPTTRNLVAAMLRAAGAQVSGVANGHQACHDAMEAFQSGKPYHVLLLDAQMPEMDGLAATMKLRELGYPGIIIALTASIADSERDRCIKAGYNDFARKPLERAKLVALVTQWANAPARSAHNGAGTGTGTGPGTGSRPPRPAPAAVALTS